MLPKFIIVVPHGLCNPELQYRHCDRRAKEASEKFRNILEKRNLPYEYFLADKYRSEIDLNRSQARDYDFRKNVRNAVLKSNNQGHHTIILETHSFPDNYYEYNNFDEMDIGLISIPRYEREMFAMAKYVKKKINFDMSPKQGIHTNDIQHDTHNTLGESSHTSHYLIEFKEDVECDDNVYETIIDASLDYIKHGGKPPIYYTYYILVVLLIIILYITRDIDICDYWDKLIGSPII
jgi:predicted N-formylglutamate amidohydrolase